MSSCLIIAGEKSGEEHAESFLPQLINERPEISFFGVGGEYFSSLGVELIYHLKDFSSWGYTEVLSKIPFYFKALSLLEEECKKRDTKYAILIDFQEFNLKLAKNLSQKGVKIFYYVAPQTWVWKSWRVKILKMYIDQLFTILPFEKQWFNDRGVENVQSVTHPVYLKYKNFKKNNTKLIESRRTDKDNISIGIFPGSRNSEIKYLLPIFLKSIKHIKSDIKSKIKFKLVYPNHLGKEIILKHISQYLNQKDDDKTRIALVSNSNMEEVFQKINFAVAASGTINLSLAFNHIPTIVCYKGSLINEFIFKSVIKYKDPVSLPNIIWGNRVFPELLQNDVTEFNISSILNQWLLNKTIFDSFEKHFEFLDLAFSSANFDVSKYLVGEMS